jgi:hypothetical protein
MLLINDGGLFCFSIGRKSQSLLAQSRLDNFSSFEECCLDFINRLKKVAPFINQPLACLIGGSRCFYYIVTASDKKSGQRLELPDQYKLPGALIRFKFIKIRGHKWLYYAGTDRDFIESLIARFNRDGILISSIQPITLFLLESLIAGSKIQPSRFIMPGEIIWFGIQKGPCFYETRREAGKEIPEPPFPVNDNTYHCFSFCSESESVPKDNITPYRDVPPQFGMVTGRNRSFFNIIKREKLLGLFSWAMRTVKLAAWLAGSLGVVALMLSVVLNAVASNYGHSLDQYQILVLQRHELENRIAALTNELEDIRTKNGRSISMAGALSSFCQGRPDGLHLKELNARHDPEKGWAIVASGLTTSENAVFDYRSYITDNAPHVSIEVTRLEENRIRDNHRRRQERPQYGFTMEMNPER